MAVAPGTAPKVKSGRYLPKLEGEARDEALREPGPSWRDWFYSSFMKTWLALSFFILDTWVALTWAVPFQPVPLVLTFVAALYVEFLFWQWLWHSPDREEDRQRQPFRRTWTRPTRFGRWTPQYRRLRAGVDPFGSTTSATSEISGFF